jgi:hypothetical protein
MTMPVVVVAGLLVAVVVNVVGTIMMLLVHVALLHCTTHVLLGTRIILH